MKIVRFKLNGKSCIFFTQVKDKAVCLICRQSLNTLKSYNLKRHHEQKHDVIAKLNDSAPNTELQLLKSNLLYKPSKMSFKKQLLKIRQ